MAGDGGGTAGRWDTHAPAPAATEVSTASALLALPAAWSVLHGLTWPRQQHLRVSHIVVGPPGIFVIETLRWPGRVTVTGGVLRENRENRSARLRVAVEAAATVSGLAPSVRFEHVHGVLCFVGKDLPGEWVDGVLVVSADHLVEELTSYVEALPGAVSRVVASDIQRQLSATPGPGVHEAPRSTWLTKAERARQSAAAAATSKPVKTTSLVRLLAATAMGLGVVAQPQMLTSLASDVAQFVTNQVEDEPRPYRPQREKRLKEDRQIQRQQLPGS